MKEKLLISGCLAGLSCRYDGGSKPHLRLDDLKRRYDLIPVCPEQAGGLSTPRIPNELQVSAAEILSSPGGERLKIRPVKIVPNILYGVQPKH